MAWRQDRTAPASWLLRAEVVAFLDRVAAQELGGDHTLLAGRLEFENVAIPPLVWIEFDDTVREAV